MVESLHFPWDRFAQTFSSICYSPTPSFLFASSFPTPVTILSTPVFDFFLCFLTLHIPSLRTLRFLVPDFGHQLLGSPFGFFPLVISCNSPATSGVLLKMGEGGLPPSAQAGAQNVCPGPRTSLRPRDSLSPPRPSLGTPPPPLSPQRPAPRLRSRWLSAHVKVPGLSPSIRQQHVARVPSSHQTPQLPEAEAGSSFSLAWDAHHGRGPSPLSSEPGATHVSQSAAPGRRKPLQGHWLLVAEADCRRNPHGPGSCARVTSGTCGFSALRRRVRVPAEPASERGPEEEGWARGSHAVARTAGLQCHLSRESPHTHTPARASTCTPWASRSRAIERL